MTIAFTTDEVATIRKFLTWARVEGWLDPDNQGLTGYRDDGFTVTQFSAESSYYDSVELEREEQIIPLLAMSEPEEYARQEAAREEAERLRLAEQARFQTEHRRAQERAMYEALKKKFEGSSL